MLCLSLLPLVYHDEWLSLVISVVLLCGIVKAKNSFAETVSFVSRMLQFVSLALPITCAVTA